MKLVYWGWVLATLTAAAALWWAVSPWATAAMFVWMLASQLVLYSVAWWDVRTDGYVLQKDSDRRWRVGTQKLDGSIEWLAPARRRP